MKYDREYKELVDFIEDCYIDHIREGTYRDIDEVLDAARKYCKAAEKFKDCFIKQLIEEIFE